MNQDSNEFYNVSKYRDPDAFFNQSENYQHTKDGDYTYKPNKSYMSSFLTLQQEQQNINKNSVLLKKIQNHNYIDTNKNSFKYLLAFLTFAILGMTIMLGMFMWKNYRKYNLYGNITKVNKSKNIDIEMDYVLLDTVPDRIEKDDKFY